MPEDKIDDTITIQILNLVDLNPTKDPNEESVGYDPYNNVPDAVSTQ